MPSGSKSSSFAVCSHVSPRAAAIASAPVVRPKLEYWYVVRKGASGMYFRWARM
jgi:hypothetical protein